MKNSFFCEACGAEVKGRADRCPSCGRSFLGIRCPRCGREGNADDFVSGCPDCGYLADLKSAVSEVETSRKKRRTRAPWPVSRYLMLSALVILVTLVILYYWVK